MKISKRQLRRIIKEEKAKVLSEADDVTLLSALDRAISRVEAVEKELYGLVNPEEPPGIEPMGDDLGGSLAIAIQELNQTYKDLELYFDDEAGRHPGGSIG